VSGTAHCLQDTQSRQGFVLRHCGAMIHEKLVVRLGRPGAPAVQVKLEAFIQALHPRRGITMKTWKYSVSSADTAPVTAPLLLLGTVENNLKAAKQMGYDAIEIHTREDEDLDIDLIRRTMRDSGMKISAIVTGRLNTEGRCDLMSDEPYIARICIECMKRYVDLAASLETDLILGWVRGRIPAGGSRKKYMDRLARNLKVVDSYAAEKNVRIMIEVINRYEINTFNTAEEVMNFLEHYDLPNCYAHLDTFHMGIEEEDPYEAIRRCGSRLGYFHLADNSRKYPGTGQIDFYRMLKALEEIDYNGYLSVECLPWPNHMEAAQNALSYMKETEQKKGA